MLRGTQGREKLNPSRKQAGGSGLGPPACLPPILARPSPDALYEWRALAGGGAPPPFLIK